MKLLYNTIIRPSLRVRYSKNINDIVRVEYYDVTNEIENEEVVLKETLSSTDYYDFSHIGLGKVYLHEMPFIKLSYQEEELYLEVACYTEETFKEEEESPQWHDIEVLEFEVPKGIETIQLKELVPEEPKIDPLVQMKAENKALEVRLETMKRQAEDDRKQNEATTLEILELMMSII